MSRSFSPVSQRWAPPLLRLVNMWTPVNRTTKTVALRVAGSKGVAAPK